MGMDRPRPRGAPSPRGSRKRGSPRKSRIHLQRAPVARNNTKSPATESKASGTPALVSKVQAKVSAEKQRWIAQKKEKARQRELARRREQEALEAAAIEDEKRQQKAREQRKLQAERFRSMLRMQEKKRIADAEVQARREWAQSYRATVARKREADETVRRWRRQKRIEQRNAINSPTPVGESKEPPSDGNLPDTGENVPRTQSRRAWTYSRNMAASHAGDPRGSPGRRPVLP